LFGKLKNMHTITFKTNIKCAACVAKVSPTLNELVGEHQWSVDLTDPDRVLSVEVESVTAQSVAAALEKVGYSAQPN
jgi:copper chaperone